MLWVFFCCVDHFPADRFIERPSTECVLHSGCCHSAARHYDSCCFLPWGALYDWLVYCKAQCVSGTSPSAGRRCYHKFYCEKYPPAFLFRSFQSINTVPLICLLKRSKFESATDFWKQLQTLLFYKLWWWLKVAITNMCIWTTDQMTSCNMKGVARVDQLTKIYHPTLQFATVLLSVSVSLSSFPLPRRWCDLAVCLFVCLSAGVY